MWSVGAPVAEKEPSIGWFKKSSGILYLPGTPTPVKCNPNKEYQAGLCYDLCLRGFRGMSKAF